MTVTPWAIDLDLETERGNFVEGSKGKGTEHPAELVSIPCCFIGLH